ncbi:MAG: N-acetylmuramoyl-L-alanine amidase [Dongiaceae bacterium]
MPDTLVIEELPSPNCDERPAGQKVDILLLHYTGMPDAGQALRRLRDPQAKVSAHYVIDEDGKIYRLVPEERRAWHAGISAWKGDRDINARSIGIEIVNPGHEFGYRPFQLAQMDALVELCKDIKTRHDIPPERVIGHSDVAPFRKQDPGELFDWYRLFVEGIAIWPTPKLVQWNDEQFYQALAAFGYDLTGPSNVKVDPQALRRAACVAFCRHFRPAVLRPVPDPEMKAVLAGLVDKPAPQS